MCKKCGIPQKTKKRQGIHLHPMFLAVVQKLGSFSAQKFYDSKPKTSISLNYGNNSSF
jgi:hypothetical protein